MWLKRAIGCPRCTCHLLVAAIFFANFLVNCTEIRDFIATNTLPDGELETRIYYKGVSAKETTVGRKVSHGVKFRELTDGKRFIQLIYETTIDGNDSLRDCEFGRQRDQLKKFLFTFKHDLSNLIATSNLTVESLDGKSLPSQIQHWFNYTSLRNICKKRHKTIEQIARSTAADLQRFQPERSKRDVTDFLIMPGTKWCGKGFTADKYTRVGGFSRTDKCCRRHDLSCPFWIGAFQTKYELFNWRVNTLMHCNCDQRFRTCLKMVGSSDANLVGKLFFNVVQTKCFVLKPFKKCVKSSWWGKCEKYKTIKHAKLRNNLPY